MAAKILTLDVETSGLEVLVFALFNQNIGIEQIIKDMHLMSASAKWLHKKEIMYKDQRNVYPMENDKSLTKWIRNLINEADIILGQNIDGFDIPIINTRIELNNILMPKPFRTIDVLKTKRKKFRFTSNKLEYTSKVLGGEEKMKSKKFPGISLWKECKKRNIEAWDEMEKYNKQDVLASESEYLRLIKWDPKINMNLYHDRVENECSACSWTRFHKNGHAYTNTDKLQRYSCARCGAEAPTKNSVLDPSKKKAIGRLYK